MKCIKLLDLNGVPVFSLTIDSASMDNFEGCSPFELLKNYPEFFDDSILFLKYRAVSVDDWENIQSHGVDVLPTDSPIYCDFMEKALEYGGWPKVMMGFDQTYLKKTFREVDADLDQTELIKLTEIYPTAEKSVDGKKIWLSRLSPDDLRRTSSYEVAYGFWISGNPWDALKVLFLVNLPDTEVEQLQHVKALDK